MRLAGTIHGEKLARQFGIYLETQGIENRLELSGTSWEVWIRDDDHWPAAKSELEEFLKDPQAERFRVALTSAAQTAHQKLVRPPVVIIRHNTLLGHRPWITTLIIILCVAIYGVTSRTPHPGNDIEKEQLESVKNRMLFEPAEVAPMVNIRTGEVVRPPLFTAIRSGEFWRLFTSCLMHGSFMHIFFNMTTLYMEGNRVERIRGPIVFAGLVLFTGVFSNTCQYLMNYYTSYSPPGSFLGFSGVLFGMFGYVFMKGRIEPRLGLFMTEQEIVFILAWTLFGLLQLLPGAMIANTAHISGAVAGMGLAWIGTMIRKAQGKA